MKFLLALAAFALTHVGAQKGSGKASGLPATSTTTTTTVKTTTTNTTIVGKGKAPAGGKAAPAIPAGPIDLSKMSSQDEKAGILALQVQSTLDNAEDAGGGSVQKGSVVDLVLQSLQMNFTAVCNASSKDYLTCANGYVSLECIFQQSAASFNGVNCIPYLSQCNDQLLAYCRSKVSPADKCKSQTACDCANEAGCGWSMGTKMCLVNANPVECGDCPTMPRCGPIDCSVATRPCDCAALGGNVGGAPANGAVSLAKTQIAMNVVSKLSAEAPAWLWLTQSTARPRSLNSSIPAVK
jgi:hypothetical protein